MNWIYEPEMWAALATLTALEIVLGIDNIIFLSIIVSQLPPEQRARARTLGLAGAMITRIALLLSLTWMMRLTEPLFTVLGEAISGRDLILLGGGLFLLVKATMEIHNALEGAVEFRQPPSAKNFFYMLIQIAVIDIVFSLDSVITAVGMTQNLAVMIIAIVIAVGVMMFASHPISDFVDKHPTIKILALSFLVMIGVALIAESLDFHIPKGYLYFAMAFSFAVEMLNLRKRPTTAPVVLHRPQVEQDPDTK